MLTQLKILESLIRVPRRDRLTALSRSLWHGVEMAVDITVDDVSESIRDRLAEKAADRSQSLEDYLLQELQRIAAMPSVTSLVEKTRRREEAAGMSDSTSEVPSESDANPR